jgi:hypothetical protein
VVQQRNTIRLASRYYPILKIQPSLRPTICHRLRTHQAKSTNAQDRQQPRVAPQDHTWIPRAYGRSSHKKNRRAKATVFSQISRARSAELQRLALPLVDLTKARKLSHLLQATFTQPFATLPASLTTHLLTPTEPSGCQQNLNTIV